MTKTHITLPTKASPATAATAKTLTAGVMIMKTYNPNTATTFKETATNNQDCHHRLSNVRGHYPA